MADCASPILGNVPHPNVEKHDVRMGANLGAPGLALLGDVRYPVAGMALSIRVLSCQGSSVG